MACLLLTLAVTAHADKPTVEPKVTGIDVGFGGKYRVGCWTPVRITVEADSEGGYPASVIVPDGDGVPSLVEVPDIVVQDKSGTGVGYVRFGRVHSDVTVLLGEQDAINNKGQDQKAFQEFFFRPSEEGPYRPAVSAEDSLIVIVGADTGIIDDAIEATNQLTAEHTVAASMLDPKDLPEEWIGYDGVSTLVLSLSDPKVAEMMLERREPYRAIDQWVRQGGHLVLLGGKMDPSWPEKFVEKDDDPKTSLLPGRPTGIVPFERVQLLEDYIDSHVPIPVPSGQRRHSVPLLELSEVQGTVKLRSGTIPLMVEKIHGFGTVTFLAVDPSVAPFDQWRDRGKLMTKLLRMPDKLDEVEAASGGEARHLGFTDLSGQMRSALDRFDGVTLIPFGLMVAIVLGYVLLIGPADYFLLKKIGRLSWTWVTFTLIVILVGIGTFWLAYRMKGDRLHLHRVDLVDVNVTEGGQVRGTSWANLFSPNDTRYDLEFSCTASDIQQDKGIANVFSWLGLPGRGLGGMNPRAADTSVWRRPYELFPEATKQSEDEVIKGVPLLKWSTKSFTARWTGTWAGSAEDPSALRSQFKLREEDELPVGRVTNPLKDQSLENCLLIYDRWAYRLETLEPGESVRIDGIHGRVRLNTLLTGRRMVADIEDKKKMRETITPYDTESTDPAYILRVMMFYDVAGGRRYARLSNRYQPFVDLSDLIAPGRAMLIGQLPADAPATTDFLVDGKPVEADQHTTVFRFIVPVEVK